MCVYRCPNASKSIECCVTSIFLPLGNRTIGNPPSLESITIPVDPFTILFFECISTFAVHITWEPIFSRKVVSRKEATVLHFTIEFCFSTSIIAPVVLFVTIEVNTCSFVVNSELNPSFIRLTFARVGYSSVGRISPSGKTSTRRSNCFFVFWLILPFRMSLSIE
jgi:hypothetical protein